MVQQRRLFLAAAVVYACSLGFGSPAAANDAPSLVGVWVDDGYFTSVGITVTSVGPNGDLKGCWWGWRHVNRHRADNSIGDPAQYDVAERSVDIFGKEAKARLNGDKLIVTTRTGATYNLIWNGNILSGNVALMKGDHKKTFMRSSTQHGTFCP